MKAYLAVKYHPDHSNRALIEAICERLERCGVNTFCVVRDLEKWGGEEFSPPDLMRRSLQAIDGSDLLVVDLGEKGVGVGIEAGYAHARGIPVWLVAPQGADLSTTLQGIARQVFIYRDMDDLEAFISRLLDGAGGGAAPGGRASSVSNSSDFLW